MSVDHPERKHLRAAMPLLIQYRFSPLEDYQTDYSADLSRGGMFIYSDSPHQVGDMLFVQFITRDGSRIIRGQGRIVRVVAEGEGDHRRLGQAVEFVDFDEDDARFVDELVRHYLHNEGRPVLRVGRHSSRTQLPQSAPSSPPDADKG